MSDSYNLHELEKRLQQSTEMGGENRIARQHNRGRMTVRERINYLLDANSFDELGQLAHSDIPEAVDKTPADGKVCGFGEIDKRTVFVSADDATVMAGAGGRVGVSKQFTVMKYAVKKGFPI